MMGESILRVKSMPGSNTLTLFSTQSPLAFSSGSIYPIHSYHFKCHLSVASKTRVHESLLLRGVQLPEPQTVLGSIPKSPNTHSLDTC